MKLVTKEMMRKIPKIGTTDGVPLEQKQIHAKFFGGGSAVWYVAEMDENADLCFGWAELLPGCGDWGYFSISELSAVRFPPFGLGVERDLYFSPKLVSEITEIR